MSEVNARSAQSDHRAVVRQIVDQTEIYFRQICLKAQVLPDDVDFVWEEIKQGAVIAPNPACFIGHIPGLHDPFVILHPLREKYGPTVKMALRGVLGKRGLKLGADSVTLRELENRTWAMLCEWIKTGDVRTELKNVSVTKGASYGVVEECSCTTPRCLCPCACGEKNSATGKGCRCARSLKFWIYRLAARAFEEWRTRQRGHRDQSASNARLTERRRAERLAHPGTAEIITAQESPDDTNVWASGPRMKASKHSAKLVDLLESWEAIEDYAETEEERVYGNAPSLRPGAALAWSMAQPDPDPYAVAVLDSYRFKPTVRIATSEEWDLWINSSSGDFTGPRIEPEDDFPDCFYQSAA